jgi:hypothetical protein
MYLIYVPVCSAETEWHMAAHDYGFEGQMVRFTVAEKSDYTLLVPSLSFERKY